MKKQKSWLHDYKKANKIEKIVTPKIGITGSVKELIKQKEKEEKILQEEKEKIKTYKQQLKNEQVIAPVTYQYNTRVSKKIHFSSELAFRKLKQLATYWDCNIPTTMDRLITDAWVRVNASISFKELLEKENEDNTGSEERKRKRKIEEDI